MIETLWPDKRGRVYLDRRKLKKIGWTYGDAVEVDIRKAITLPKADKVG